LPKPKFLYKILLGVVFLGEKLDEREIPVLKGNKGRLS